MLYTLYMVAQLTFLSSNFVADWIGDIKDEIKPKIVKELHIRIPVHTIEYGRIV